MEVFEKTYFEVHGEELLTAAGLNKVQFAEKVGIAPQNVKKLFGTKNLATLIKVGEILNISLQVLVYGKEQTSTDVHGCIYVDGKPHLISRKEDIEELLKSL